METTPTQYPELTLPEQLASQRRNLWLSRLALLFVILLLVAAGASQFSTGPLSDRFQTLVTIFLGIFVEAVPFLLAGAVVSGFIEVYVNKEMIARYVPRHPLAAAFVGSVLGFAFPVCECGVVPVTRRLYQKGLPLSVGIAFLLAAPVVNPVVLVSTYVAFGWGPVLIGRFLFTILIALIVGFIFYWARPSEVLLPARLSSMTVMRRTAGVAMGEGKAGEGQNGRLTFWDALNVGGDDFMDMVRYLIIGSMMAAAMQTFVPQATLLSLGRGPVISVILLMTLAFVLSICSTVDSFVALSFVNSFTTGSILGFLVFGPMVDIKSALMFLGVFKRRIVGYLILLPLLLTLLISVFINLNLGW